MNTPKVFILILNYNGKHTLAHCLQSVYQLRYPNFDVVVIDNDSKDGSLEEAKRLFPRAHFIKNMHNLGFSAGNNVGIRFALEKMADYVWLLNNDAKVDRDSLNRLVKVGENYSRTGILSPLILHSKTKNIWFAGGKIDWMTMKAVHVPPQSLDKPIRTEYISGCAMLVKKEVFREIGLLDEHFFLYYEDADFSLRARYSGFELEVIPDAQVFHEEVSVENPSKIYWLVVSGLQFFHKHAPWYYRPWLVVYLALRKAKNWRDLLWRKHPSAVEVRRAYTSYRNLSREKSQ
jgi:GT2 family glycosyltransferase